MSEISDIILIILVGTLVVVVFEGIRELIEKE